MLTALTVVFANTLMFGTFCAKLTPWVESAAMDESGVVTAEVLMYGEIRACRLQVNDSQGNIMEILDGGLEGHLDEDVEVVVCPDCGSYRYYPYYSDAVTCRECNFSIRIYAVPSDPEQSVTNEGRDIVVEVEYGCQDDITLASM